MGSEVRVSITADSSQLGTGLDAATSQVQASASKMAEAQQRATVATKALAEAQAQLGASAAAGNAQAAQILAEYATAATAAAAAADSLSTAQAANVVTAEAQAIATSHTVPQFSAASGALRLLEGNFQNNIRAAERFLSTTLGLGPVLQAAFPIVGAIAMAGILVEIGSKLVDFSEKAEALASELNTDWLTAAIGQLTGLGKAVEEADKQIEKFAKDNDEAKTKIAAAAVEQARLNAELEHPGPKASQAGAIAADNVRAQQIQKRIDALQREKELASQAAEEYRKGSQVKTGAIDLLLPEARDKERKAAEQQKLEEQAIAEIKSVELEQTSLIAEKTNLILQAEVARTKIEKPKNDRLGEEIAKASIEAQHAMDASLPPAQQITEELEKHLQLNLAAERSSKDGTAAERERLRALQDEVAVGKANADTDKLAHDAIMSFFEEQTKSETEAARKQSEDEKKQAEDYKRSKQEQIALAKEQAEDQIRAAQQEFEFTEREIRYEAELGIISSKVAAQRLADASRLKQTQTQGALSKEQGLFDPALGQKELQEYTALENRMTQEARKGALEREQITQQETLKVITLYKRVATEFNRDFTTALDAWVTKSQTVGQAFGRMFGQLELQLINFVAEWAAKKAEQWALDEALQLTGITKQHINEAASNAATITADAATAAAGAEASAAPAGPEAMAAAGAAAEVIVLGNLAQGTHDFGGMIPHMGLAFNTSGSVERVLSPSQTSNFESLVNNTSSGRSFTFNQENHNHGVTPAMMEAHTQRTVASIRGMLRPEAFK